MSGMATLKMSNSISENKRINFNPSVKTRDDPASSDKPKYFAENFATTFENALCRGGHAGRFSNRRTTVRGPETPLNFGPVTA